MAFDVNFSQFGFIPLVSQVGNLKEPKGVFQPSLVEDDLPFKFHRPPGLPGNNSFAFSGNFGLAF